MQPQAHNSTITHNAHCIIQSPLLLLCVSCNKTVSIREGISNTLLVVVIFHQQKKKIEAESGIYSESIILRVPRQYQFVVLGSAFRVRSKTSRAGSWS